MSGVSFQGVDAEHASVPLLEPNRHAKRYQDSSELETRYSGKIHILRVFYRVRIPYL